MISNYYTLAAVVREINKRCAERPFIDAYSLRPDELRLRFDSIVLVTVLRPINGTLFLTLGQEVRPSKNSKSFFEELSGQPLKEAVISPHDRVIFLHFNDYQLHLSFFGQPNAVLYKENTVVESFKKLSDKGPQIKESKSVTTADTSLRALYPMLGKKLEQEFMYQLGLQDALLPLSQEQQIASKRLVTQLENAHAYIYNTSSEPLLSLIPLQSLKDVKSVEEKEVSEAIRSVIVSRGKAQRFQSKKREVVNALQSLLERTEKALQDVRQGQSETKRAERYTAIATALLEQGYSIIKGTKKTILIIDEKPVDITLDPLLNPFENASKYFEKAKHSREAKIDLLTREERLTKELELLGALLLRSDDVVELKQIEEIEEEIREIIGKSSLDQNRIAGKESNQPNFRAYKVHGNYTVLIGKNAKQNDELTLHVAKKEDVWLHARGVAGSHVIIQVPNKNASVPKEAIEQAAQLAAYYSDARTQSVAPVSYTKKKFVRKAKGGVPGAVIMEREEVVLVKPQLSGKEL